MRVLNVYTTIGVKKLTPRVCFEFRYFYDPKFVFLSGIDIYFVTSIYNFNTNLKSSNQRLINDHILWGNSTQRNSETKTKGKNSITRGRNFRYVFYRILEKVLK